MTNTTSVAPSTVKNIASLLVALFACFTAAGVGSIAVSQTLETWYIGLNKPSWNPPNWVFGPVWTVLYTAMAFSAWLVWKNRAAQPAAARTALAWFAGQLVLNTAWSWLFFANRQLDAAFVEIVLLWIAILVTILTSARVSVTAALLLVPYLLWVTFASTLNGAIWRLNA